MFGDEAGLDPLDEIAEAGQVAPIEVARRAEREPDAVKGDGVFPPHALEQGELGSTPM